MGQNWAVRRSVVALCALVLAIGWMPSARAAVPVLVIDGKGFGHGVGLSQEGALTMGRQGASTEQILGHFYPGTGLARGAGGNVRVVVHHIPAVPTSAMLSFPSGGEVRGSGEGFPVSVSPGAAVRVVWNGARYTVEGGTPAGSEDTVTETETEAEEASAAQVPLPSTTTTAPSPDPTTTTTTGPVAVPTTTTTTAPGDEDPSSTTSTTTATADPEAPSSTTPVIAAPAGGSSVTVPARGRTYRGIIEVNGGGGPLRLLNVVDVETYLKGMGEVRDPRWPQSALRSQAIIARTYALRAMSTSGELCDTQRCQVYLGATAEYAAMNKAVEDSRGQVVMFRRALATTVYSANSGGHSATPAEGFGTSNQAFPYLRAAPNPSADPFPWTVRVAVADVARRFGYGGEVTNVRIAKTGPSGRATEVVLEGSAGAKSVTGIAFDAGLGLRSTLFTLRIELSDDVPTPPPAEDVTFQALPEDTAAAAGATVLSTAAVPELPPAEQQDDTFLLPGLVEPTESRTVAAALGFGVPWLLGAIAFTLSRLARFRSGSRDDSHGPTGQVPAGS